MRMPQLRKLLLLAIVAAFLIILSRLISLPSSIEDLDSALGARGLDTYTRQEPRIPLDTKHDDDAESERDLIQEKDMLPLDHEKAIMSRGHIDLQQRMKEINALRQEVLAKECIKLKSSGIIAGNADVTKLAIKPELFVSDEHKAIFCSTGSEHSESWRRILGNVELRYLFSYRQESIAYRLQYYYKILLVEHPFVRFISAFKKALSNDEEPLVYSNKRNDELQRLSFKSWQHPGRRNSEAEGNKTDPHPILSDFSEFVITSAEKEIPLHPLWERIYLLCQPCSLYYDYISRDHTAMEDEKFIFSKLEKTPPVQYPRNHTLLSEAESLEDMKRVLDKKTLSEIYEVYKIDHDLLGYLKPWD